VDSVYQRMLIKIERPCFHMDDCTYLFVLFFFLKKSFSTFPKEKHFDRCDAKEGKRSGRVVGRTAPPPLRFCSPRAHRFNGTRTSRRVITAPINYSTKLNTPTTTNNASQNIHINPRKKNPTPNPDSLREIDTHLLSLSTLPYPTSSPVAAPLLSPPPPPAGAGGPPSRLLPHPPRAADRRIPARS
jgi:hypothetical protein